MSVETLSAASNLKNVSLATNWLAALRNRSPEQARHDVLNSLADLERGSAPLTMDSINAVAYSEEQLAGAQEETLQNYVRNAGISKQTQHAICQAMCDTYGAIARLYKRFLTEKSTPDAMTEDLCGLLACRGMFALGNRLKWVSFRQEQLDAGSWLNLHALYQIAEQRGIEQRRVTVYLKPKETASSPAQAYAKTLLFATLASGAFNPRQLQSADEWLLGWTAGSRLDDQFDRHKHYYYVDLTAPTGARRILGATSGGELRFLSTDALALQVERSKVAFRQGQVSTSAGIDPVSRAGEYAELLDKVDRIWSPEWMRSDQRSNRRVAANNEPIIVVRGLNELATAASEDYEAEQPEGTQGQLSQEEEFDLKIYGFVREQTRAKALQARNAASRVNREAWQLVDESVNGYGALSRAQDGSDLRLGQMLGVKRSKSNRWAVGFVTRLLMRPEESMLFVGMEILSHNPVIVTLAEESEAGAAPHKPSQALFIPGDQSRGRADSLIIDSAMLAIGKDFTLSARNASYYVRMPRVIRKGQGWQRVAFEVLAKRN